MMIRAVICDDEKAAHNIIRFFVEREKLPVEIVGSAENGRDAWQLIEREKPDLIFMDIHMPSMDGFEVIQKIRTGKVIVITAYDSFEYAQKALRLGASDILAKPIELEQLKQAIARTVGGRFTDNKTVNAILVYLYEHHQEQIELSRLAELAFCSESHIARLFKRHVGMSIISYVHKLRIERSVALMEQQSYSVKEAAEAVGYRNLNHFYEHFSRIMGTTPAAYMKRS